MSSLTLTAQADDIIPTSGGGNNLYYHIGGGSDFALSPVQSNQTIDLNSNTDLGAGDDWTSQRSSEKVAALVGSIALDSAEAELLDKLLLQVENDHLERTNLKRLLLHLIPRLILANVGEEANDLVSFLFTDVLAQVKRGVAVLAYQ